jgi:membrane-associated protease RseP (regulator of RpoE activity)
MTTAIFKAAPLFLLLAFPPVSSSAAGDEPRDEKKIVINGERVRVLDDDDPMVFHFESDGGGYLGVHLLEITPALREHFGAPRDAGVLVAEVEPGSPAAKAGLQVGDVLTRVDGDRVESSRELSRLVRRKKNGETVKVEVQRNKSSRTLTATIEERKRREIDLGDLRRRIRDQSRDWGRDFRDFRFEMPRMGRLEGLERLQDKLKDLEKRLSDLEKKMPSR